MDYTRVLNQRVVNIKPSGIRKFFDIAEQMENVISLGVGEPDFHTPWHIRQAAVASLEQGKTRYTSNGGLLELRRAISTYVREYAGVDYRPETEILVTVGGSEAIDAALRALVEPGDEVLIPQPSFVCYEPLTLLAGGTPVIVPTRQENNFRLTPEDILDKITEHTKVLIMPYPCNPTGAIMEKQDLERIAEVIEKTNIMILSDEIYSELTFSNTRHQSIAGIKNMQERTVLINGFSKSFSMTGWRLGYACGPEPILKQMTKIHQFGIMSAPSTSQYAAIDALKNGKADVVKMREEYNNRRKIIVDGFNRLGLTCFEPKGAFYAFPNITSTGMTSEEFCERLLYEQSVALVPGSAFGDSGEGFVRASYCYSIQHIKTALARIEVFLKTIQR
ncbi:MAG: aminotransferase class I/II-fold pyridoxal phosphate-dependent enzyme [Clostridia bacterium]|nr:aminotransferase class I/II-fold pyridoxal phosphate-dependent enzyme [Clostridia bacterium]MBQ7289171.1 aminotransferase class I/II-fold pyridoxal phosphate-dependent enzyme [Clostridia bacterium]